MGVALYELSPPKLAPGKSNLRPWKEYTSKSEANTTRPTQIDFNVSMLIVNLLVFVGVGVELNTTLITPLLNSPTSATKSTLYLPIY